MRLLLKYKLRIQGSWKVRKTDAGKLEIDLHLSFNDFF